MLGVTIEEEVGWVDHDVEEGFLVGCFLFLLFFLMHYGKAIYSTTLQRRVEAEYW